VAAEPHARQRGDEFQLRLCDCQRTSFTTRGTVIRLVLQHKLLNPFASVHFSGVEVALRIGNDLMHPMKLAGVAAIVSRLA